MIDLFKSGDASVRKAEESDVAEIAASIRESDREELWATGHLEPLAALKVSFAGSIICWTVVLSGKAVAMFGVVPVSLLGPRGIVWLLATKDFCKLNRRFLRRSREFVKIMLAHYSHLSNYVDARNTESIRWLSFCGAEIFEPRPYGVENKPFHYFEFHG